MAFRGDAAFAKPEIYEALEERKVKYAIRFPSNDSSERKITELLTRPVGRPSYKPGHERVPLQRMSPVAAFSHKFVPQQYRQTADSRRRFSIFESRSRATARASGFP